MTDTNDKPTQTLVGTDGRVRPMPELPDPGLPESIGGYRIVRKLGQGGMGVVYEAIQSNPRRQVALKILRGARRDDPTHLRMFQREVDTLGRLKHPSIAAIYESGITPEGEPFFVMELVRGSTLTEWLAHRGDGPMAASEFRLRLALFRRICNAVAYAHQRGVIHRDIKPSNVLVTEREEVSSGSSTSPGLPEIKVLDFGLARITDTDLPAVTEMTEIGAIKGTLPYMSPEQARGKTTDTDIRTDVYSLGVVLYEMLTGQLPYDLTSGGLPEAARAICEDAPLPLTRSGAGQRKFDRDISTIVLKALEKEPSRRYQSVAAFGEDIDRYFSDQPILARPPSAAYQLKKLILRHKFAFAASVSLLVLTVAFAVTMFFMYVRAETATVRWQRASAEAEAARLRAEEERSRARLQAQRAEAEKERADESRAEIELTSRELEAIIPGLRARLQELELQLARQPEEPPVVRKTEVIETPGTPAPDAPAPEYARVGRLLFPVASSAASESPETPPGGGPVSREEAERLLLDLALLQGRIALRAGRHEEAEQHLLQCRSATLPGPHKEQCVEHLLQLHEARGELNQARKYRQELEQLRGPD